MSKVVHLSDDAHNKAKAHCKRLGLKMSDWVAVLIEQALVGTASPVLVPTPTQSASSPSTASLGTVSASSPTASSAATVATLPVAAPSHSDDSNVCAFVPKKKVLEPVGEPPQLTSNGVPPYAEPPFWQKATS